MSFDTSLKGSCEAEYREAAKFHGVPDSMVSGYRLYVENRVRPGGFLLAVLQNDLVGASQAADAINRKHLYEHAEFCFNCLPGNCWGSREAVVAWLKGGKR